MRVRLLSLLAATGCLYKYLLDSRPIGMDFQSVFVVEGGGGVQGQGKPTLNVPSRTGDLKYVVAGSPSLVLIIMGRFPILLSRKRHAIWFSASFVVYHYGFQLPSDRKSY